MLFVIFTLISVVIIIIIIIKGIYRAQDRPKATSGHIYVISFLDARLSNNLEQNRLQFRTTFYRRTEAQ